MDDSAYMAEMYLTEKKRRMETSLHADSPHHRVSGGGGLWFSAPVSPVSSPPEARRSEKILTTVRSRSSDSSSDERIVELEMLLEAYFVVIDGTLNKLTTVGGFVFR